ncbi:MAG: SDR family oxidoreductase [Rhodospirillales bacterium]|nr:SDR family oxidoreductase [Rhodospirillales bacterium]
MNSNAQSPRLAGKVAIVTGAGSGFGAAIAQRFAREGARVVVADIDPTAADRVAAGIAGTGGQAVACAVDVAQGASVERLAGVTTQAFGRLDICVNNAGIAQRYGPILDVAEAEFDRLMAINVKSLFWCARTIAPVMAAGGGGVILNTSSASALRPRPGSAWYNTSKAAVNGATKSMALDLAPHRIRVCALCPVAADTPLFAEALSGLANTEADRARLRAQFEAGVPLGRLCKPEDMANAALFLASDEAAFLTGVCLEVDGGRTI